MRKREIFTVLAIFIVLVFSSCAGLGKGGQRAPYWYYSPQQRANNFEIAFTGEGYSESERQATLFAYQDLNNKLYRYLGIDSDEESYRELSTKGTISSFNLKIAERYQYQTDGSYTIYILALADKKKVQSARSEDALKESEIASQAEKLILEGDELIKSYQDISGLKKYLQSMVLTYSLSQIENEYSFNVILDEVLDIIATTEISLADENFSEASCKVNVKRRDTMIPSDVQNGLIKASFKAVGSSGSEYDDSFVFATDINGSFYFRLKNYLMSKAGKVVFTLDIYDEIEKIAKLSQSAAEKLYDALENSGVSMAYSIQYSEHDFGFCIFELTGVDTYVNSESMNLLLKKKFDADGVRSFPLKLAKTDMSDEEIVIQIPSLNSDIGYMVIIRSAVSDIISSSNNICSCTIQGNVKIYQMENSEIMYDSGLIYANGFGENEKKAKEDSCANFISTVYSLIKGRYV